MVESLHSGWPAGRGGSPTTSPHYASPMHWLITCLVLILSDSVPPSEQAPPRRDAREFLPSVHGFHFRNTFTGSPLPESVRGLGLEQVVKMPTRYGKCGGMSAAAADFFLSHTPIPPDTKPPKEGTPLFGYITSRQIDSLGTLGSMTGKFMEMMAAPDTSPDAPSAASLTAPHIEPLLRRLNEGELVAIGLVYVASPRPSTGQSPAKELPEPTPGSNAQDSLTPSPGAPPGAGTTPAPAQSNPPRTGTLWENHQVLAFASPGQLERWHSEQACAEIRIYDPNFPDNDRMVIFVRKIPHMPNQPLQVFCEQRAGPSRTIPLRGFFPMPYAPRTPELAAVQTPASGRPATPATVR